MSNNATREIPISDVRKDGGAQMRVRGIDSAVVDDYSEAMRQGATLPPIIVFYDGEVFWLGDGFHRIEAAIATGAESILAEVREGTSRDAIIFAAGANSAHGLRRTSADKRNAVERLLRDPEWAKWSSREIGKACAVDHKTVEKVRRELTGDFPTDRTYLDKHGNVSTMKTAERAAVIRSGAKPTHPAGSMVLKLLAAVPDDALLSECERRGLKVQ